MLGSRGAGELTVAPFQPVVLTYGVPTKTDAAMDRARVGMCGDGGTSGMAGCDADEGQEEGSEVVGEPWHGA